MRSDEERLARGGLLNLFGVIMSAILQFALVVMVTRGVSRSAAGAFFEATALFLILSNIGDLGADDGLVRGFARQQALRRFHEARFLAASAFVPVLAVGAVSALLVAVFAAPIAHVFFSSREWAVGGRNLLYLSVLLPAASVMSLALSATRGLGSMRPYVIVQNIGLPLVRVACVAAVIVAGLGETAIALAWAGPVVLGCAGALLALRRMMGRPDPTPTEPARPFRLIAKELWSFSAPRALASTFTVTITYFDVLLVGALASTRDAAVYAAASRVWVAGTFALQAVVTAVAPQVSELFAAREHDRLERLYQTSTCWIMTLSWPIYFTFVIFAPVITQVFGGSYRSGAGALQILSAGGLATTGSGGSPMVLLMGGNSRLQLLNSAGALAVNVCLNVALIPLYGIEGAAFAWTASIVITNAAAAVQVSRIAGLLPFGRGYWVIGGASLAIFGAGGLMARLLFGEHLATLISTGLVESVVYCAVLWIARDTIGLGALVGSLRARSSAPR